MALPPSVHLSVRICNELPIVELTLSQRVRINLASCYRNLLVQCNY
jgi:hypothetical protein